MKVKAKVGFSGEISMSVGQVGEIDREDLLSDLLQAGYVEEVKEPVKAEKAAPKKKAVKSSGNRID